MLKYIKLKFGKMSPKLIEHNHYKHLAIKFDWNEALFKEIKMIRHQTT